MGVFEPSYSVPELEEVEASVVEEFLLEPFEYWAVVQAKTGMVRLNAGWTCQPERVVAFSGQLYETSAKEDLVGEYEMFHVELTLRQLPKWMRVLARLANEEEPDSVEEFFYDFMFQLGYDANVFVEPSDVMDVFDSIVESLQEQNGFADEASVGESWKPYCQVYSKEFVEY